MCIRDRTNTLTTSNNVTAAAAWPIPGLAVGPCGPLNYPVGVAVLQGNYNAGNVSSGKTLEIYRPGVVACPMVLVKIGGFEFQPSSDNATLEATCQQGGGGCMTEIVNATVSFDGYWNGSAFTSFPSGVYTVVAGDEWGGVAIVHFTVNGSGA